MKKTKTYKFRFYPNRGQVEKRIYDCPACNLSIDRDHNAAINILNRAGTARMSTPVETISVSSMNQEAPSARAE